VIITVGEHFLGAFTESLQIYLTFEGFARRALIRIYTVSSKGTRPPSFIILRMFSPSFVPYSKDWKGKYS
jgi:hypothetical protein